MMAIDLPWPDSELSPNRKPHWAKLAKHKKEYREHCRLLASSFINRHISIPEVHDLHISLKFFPPKNLRYDMDNLLSRMKSGLDGVCDAWGINDYRFRAITITMGEVEKEEPRVRLEILNS